MNANEQLLFDKMEEYIEYLEKLCKVEYYASPPIQKHEISQLKSDIKEQSEISAEECLEKWGIDLTVLQRILNETAYKNILSAMHEFRNQGRDWEKIEKECSHKSTRQISVGLSICNDCGNAIKNNL